MAMLAEMSFRMFIVVLFHWCGLILLVHRILAWKGVKDARDLLVD